jgi:hypothetical protein
VLRWNGSGSFSPGRELSLAIRAADKVLDSENISRDRSVHHASPSNDSRSSDAVAALHQRHLVPLIFAPHAVDLAARLVPLPAN